MSLDLTEDKSTLVQVMAWCRLATSHYLNQCWPSSMSPYGITRPQWVNNIETHFKGRYPECHKSSLMLFNNVDPDLCHHMASLGHNELTHWGWDKMTTIFQTTLSDVFFFYGNYCILFQISLKIISEGIINIKSALVQWVGTKTK